MASVKQLQEERAPIGARIRKMADMLGDHKPDFTAEERAEWDRLNADFNRMTTRIEAERSAVKVTQEFDRRPSDTPGLEDTTPRSSKSGRKYREEVADEARALAIQGWARHQHGLELTTAQRKACKLTGLNPNRRTLLLDLPRRPGQIEKRSMSALPANGSSGAYAIPQGFVYMWEKALKDYNGMRQVADVIRTESGNQLPWPTTNDTSNLGEMIGENTTVAQQDVALGQTMFGAYKFSSKMVTVPSELLDDSAFALGEELFPMLGERIGRKQEQMFTTGTGSSQPQGMITGATLGKTAASATAIAADEIIDLIHSVDPAYRRDPSFRIMFHDLILAVVRKMKDSQNRYLFEEGQNGAPDRIKGVPIAINQNMASTVATGNKTMAVGAFRKFKIRDVKQIRLRRLEERYAEMDQVGFIAYLRSDSKVLDAGTAPIKYLQQA